MTVLSVDGLSVSYATRTGRREVLHDVSFDVGDGEVVALVGESGSGKSTTAHAVLGLLPEGGRIERGAVRLGDVDIATWTPRQLRAVRGAQIGLVPQDPVTSLDPVRPIGVQIGEIFRVHGERNRTVIRARVLELLERVGLDDPALRARQHPHELSGGMRQRVLIAIAIALRPRLIIGDEPTSALDVTVQRRILDLIDDLRREEGTSVLLVTHDLGVAADRAQRIVVLKDGSVVEQGTTAEILSRAEDPYTRQLLADAPALATTAPRRVPAPLYLRDASAVAAENPYAIVATALVKEFRTRGRESFRAVDDVSFRVRRGTTHALVGESGSGKTTTARLVTRFLAPDAGTIEVMRQDVAPLRGDALRALRRSVQLVYQNPFSSLDPRQSVEQIIVEPLHNFGEGRAPNAEIAPRSSPTGSRSPRSCSRVRRGSSRAGSASAWRSLARSPSVPRSWCWTKRCRPST